MEPGLDSAFLKYIGVTSENQRPIRAFYRPMFEGCRQVVDLGCGTGDFVALLRETGIDAIGVDSDAMAYETLQQKGLPIIFQDVIEYLETVEPDSLDGIYSAHLIEHLPHKIGLKLIRLSFKALRPGGRLVLATPSPRALVSHLEMYHMHFGHQAFYHPKLLSFFMEYCGFCEVSDGENPLTTPLRSTDIFQPPEPGDPPQTRISYRRAFPPVSNPIRRLIRVGKTLLFRFIVQPFLDDFEDQTNRILAAHQTAIQHTGVVDRAFECYVSGIKPPPTHADPKPG